MTQPATKPPAPPAGEADLAALLQALTKAGAMTPSWVRTVSPFAVGWLLSLAVTGRIEAALHIDGATARQLLDSGVTLALGAGYYGVIRLAETRHHRRWGWFLGLPHPPAYPTTVTAVPAVKPATPSTSGIPKPPAPPPGPSGVSLGADGRR